MKTSNQLPEACKKEIRAYVEVLLWVLGESSAEMLSGASEAEK